MYVAAGLRGSGLAHILADAVEAHARAAGGRVLRLWSDTRFSRAHRFYERRGFVRGDRIRPLHDLSNTLEYAFSKRIES